MDGKELENALKAAATVAALQNERRQEAAREMTLLADRIDRGSLQRAAQEFIAPLLAQAGSASVERFEQARREYETALQKAADESRLTAIAESNPNKSRLDLAMTDRVKALDAVAGPDAPRTLLKSPFSIIPTAGLANFSSIERPAHNSAKFTLHSSRSNGYEEVAFHFIWGNTTNEVKVIDVDAYFVLHGHVTAGSGGGNFPAILSGDRYSQLDLRARVAISLWSSEPTTPPMEQPDQNVLALALRSNTGGWGSPGGIEVADVFRGYDLRHELLLVPPHTNVVFQVIAGVTYSNANGTVDLDFSSDGFEVGCPGVLVTIRS